MPLITMDSIASFVHHFATTLFAFVLVIGPAIFIHELGHFLVAKRCGIKVFTFSLGFGPKIFSIERGGTEYRLSWIPLGGYVKMAGEEPGEAHTGSPDEFASKTIGQRVAVIVAGPAANVLLGIVLCFFICLVGLESAGYLPRVGYIAPASPAAGILEVGDEITAIDGAPVTSWFEIDRRIRSSAGRELGFDVMRAGTTVLVRVVPAPYAVPDDLGLVERAKFAVMRRLWGDGTLKVGAWIEPVVGSLKEDGGASRAGVAQGDRIVRIGDSPVIQWGDIGAAVQLTRGETVTVVIARSSETMVLAMKPKMIAVPTVDGAIESSYAIGIVPTVRKDPQGPLNAAVSSVFMTYSLGKMVLVTLHKLITRSLSIKMLAGPLGIAQGSGVSFREGGIEELIYFLALISINLGVVNLLPFPLLDGGWIFIFLTYEFFRGKPMSQKAQERLMQAGLALLLTLIVFITYNDFARLLKFQTVEDILEETSR